VYLAKDDGEGKALCPAATGISHHINPWGGIEPCPIVQFSKESITGMGAPWGLCIPRADAGGKQYIFSSDGTSGRLYKIDLASGKVVGWAQTSLGRGEDDAGRLVHEIGCKDPNVVYLGSAILWNVTKVTITP